uniref:Uncharacterized protein n=1 Tax=Romanomermis culicivorax TaxID=13658 RepID=A0A915HPR7_ROMCU
MICCFGFICAFFNILLLSPTVFLPSSKILLKTSSTDDFSMLIDDSIIFGILINIDVVYGFSRSVVENSGRILLTVSRLATSAATARRAAGRRIVATWISCCLIVNWDRRAPKKWKRGKVTSEQISPMYLNEMAKA